MKKISRIIISVLSLAMITAYFMPIWDISLEAPQYPEGLGMKIWINRITGDLQTINGLNHYIGMKTIEPDSIAELKIMPYILGLLILGGIFVSLSGKRKIFFVWVILLVISGIAGGVDFYLWEYDYGHNLDPNAAIKVPGMTYQPPFIGSKKLLNFVAHSYPDTGGYVIFFTGIISVLIFLFELNLFKLKQINKPGKLSAAILTLLCMVFIFSCSREPKPISFGKDMCELCRMTISDHRFGAEIVTTKGRVYKFDAAECMFNFISVDNINFDDIHSMYVIDCLNPGNLTEASSAVYLISENFPSPMGANLSCYSSRNDAETNHKTFGGEIKSWEEIKNIFKLR